ncbi:MULTISPECIES: hypothetical protein [unclassified Wolbachia]|nr:MULTISPECIES: hypothetical protein [unclassified Wolbachia]
MRKKERLSLQKKGKLSGERGKDIKITVVKRIVENADSSDYA